MKTAEEVAEQLNVGLDDVLTNAEITAIAKAITAYAEERVLDAFDNKFKNEHKRCLEIARAEALEEAAKIADNFWKTHENEYEGHDIAAEIRTLKDKK